MHEPSQGRRGGLSSWFAGLSRPRRMLAVAAAIAILVAAGTVAIGAASGAPPQAYQHQALAHARRAGRPGPASPVGPAQDRPGPVLLVPGYGGDTGSLAALASRIRAAGRRAIVLSLPGTGTGSLVADAALLNAAVVRAMRGGAPSVDVIGYSAGGVVALLWARHDDGAARARRIVTLGAPFHGTQLAAVAQALVPGQCPAACRQLVPGSPLLTSLDVARGAGLPPWLSIWTADDKVVTPPGSARLAGAIDIELQAVCPTLAVTHSQLPTDPAVINMVLGAVSRAPMATPNHAVCH